MASETGGGEWGQASPVGGRPAFRWLEQSGAYKGERGGGAAAAVVVTPAEAANSHSSGEPIPAVSPASRVSPSVACGAMPDERRASGREKSPLMRRLRRRRGTVATVGILGVLILLLLLAFLAFGKDSVDEDNLLMVSVIFRHGDRTPTETYPNDPHQESAWPEGFGALTNEGKMQMFVLGEWLRARYGRLVGAEYDPQALRVLSSARDRCLMSAEALLAGLMPPSPRQRWHPDLAWQPIPVHYAPRDRDALIAAKKPCRRYDQELQEAYNSPEIQKINSDNKELYEYLTKHTGKPITNITDVEFLYTTLLIEQIHNLELPEWTKSVFPGEMKELAAKSLAIFTFNDFMKKIRGGPLIKEIVARMVDKSKDISENPKQMYLYSAHDLTIINVWRALGFSELLNVEYGGSLIFELRWIEQGVKLEVKALYLNSSSTTKPIELKIPGCEEPCHVQSLLTVTQHLFPTDWEKECTLSS